ncbi:AT-hook motif nuclear-localized protein [Actinidia chinensis var. chinensis]|uniref:AT-hook motif nuclear-localized protein n=1 Tax=Actinidia chinensis var. chinensis TaxID=1590841 RepID=A0A2R6RNM2_ACTCC|nr:AT-hook motif nuclear-localized protein [Actinidia chinensis var. chinensis]
MKGEYVDEKEHPKDMFAKVHLTQPTTHHHFQLTHEDQDPEPDNPAQTPSNAAKKESNSDGASIEVSRRPRGRPPGSKNKPKPPVIITRETEPGMSPYMLEIPAGADVAESVARFCRRNSLGLCVLNASGAVANVSLRQPTTPGSAVTFHGRFDILSLSATILPPGAPPVGSGFTISFAGPQGQIIGGAVVGPLLAAATVYVVAASFNNPAFHRLPEEDGVGSAGSEGRSSPGVSGGGDCGHPPASAAAETCGMAIYSCHLPSDVIWAPAARQPPPHYG